MKIKQLISGFKKSSPEIFFGVGISMLCCAVIDSARSTIRHKDKLEELKKADRKDKIVGYAKCYASTMALSVGGLSAVTYGYSKTVSRTAAIAGLYSLSESALNSYKSNIKKVLTKEDVEKVEKEVCSDIMSKHKVDECDIIRTQYGDTLCFEPILGKYFYSSIDQLSKAEIEINRQLRNEMTVTLNDYYYELGIPRTKLGAYLGWHIDIGGLEFNYKSQLTDDLKPCLVIEIDNLPLYLMI